MSNEIQKLAEQIEYDYSIQASNHESMFSISNEYLVSLMHDEIAVARMFGIDCHRNNTPDWYFDKLLTAKVIKCLSLIHEAYDKADIASKALITFEDNAKAILDNRTTRSASYNRTKLRLYHNNEVIHVIDRIQFCSSLIYIAKLLES